MRKSKFKKSDVKFLMFSESPNVIWAYGVPKKGSAEYSTEYMFFEFQFKDKRRHGIKIYIDKGEVKMLKKAFKLAEKHHVGKKVEVVNYCKITK